MDDMQQYEIPLLIENFSLSTKQDWLRSRICMWASLKPYMKKKISPEELFPLQFETKENKGKSKGISLNNDQIRNYLNNQKKRR